MAFLHLVLFFILLLLQPHLLPAHHCHIIADFNQEKDFKSKRVPNHNEIAVVNRRGGGGGGGHGGGGGGHGGGYGNGRVNGRRPNPAAVVIPVIAGGASANRHHHHGATGNGGTLNRAITFSYFVLTTSVSLLLSQA